MSDRELYFRRRIFFAAVVALFGILTVNLFVMTVPQNRYYKDKALENRQVEFRVRPPRGRILDRDGTLLADNMFIADITMPASGFRPGRADTTLERLLEWFHLPRDETLLRLLNQQEAGRARLTLVPNATMPQIAAVEERRSRLPGIRVDTRPRRRYLFDSLFAHLIGYVGEVDQADLDTAGGDQDYRLRDMIGKQGIESAAEARLRGRSGIKLEEVNAAGHIVGRRPFWVQEVVPGRDIQLTLSLPLQMALAGSLGDRPGCGVAMSCLTGEILAAYSSPSFDPNLMTAPVSTEQWNALINDPAKPFFNRFLQATYPPASLYKTVTSLAGLQHGVIAHGTVLDPCRGGYSFGNRFFRCWKKEGHGHVDHSQALINSCDTFYYQVGLRLDIDELAAAARALGLGSRCAGIFAEEAAGLVPDRRWYDQRYGPGGWTRAVLLNNAIGQGELLVTPLQMVQLAARVASSGRVPMPRFVADADAQADAGAAASSPLPLPFAPRDLDWLRRTLAQVVENGTGRQARLEDVAVAGKTGTAQNPHGEDHAWFMCFAPVEQPEVALVVMVENAGHGGTEAAPVAGSWLDVYFHQTDRPGLRPVQAPPARNPGGTP